jgi:hypothetical protein
MRPGPQPRHSQPLIGAPRSKIKPRLCETACYQPITGHQGWGTAEGNRGVGVYHVPQAQSWTHDRSIMRVSMSQSHFRIRPCNRCRGGTAGAAAHKLLAMPTDLEAPCPQRNPYSNMQSPWSPSIGPGRQGPRQCRAAARNRTPNPVTSMKRVLPVRNGHEGRPSRTRKTRKCRIPHQDPAGPIHFQQLY